MVAGNAQTNIANFQANMGFLSSYYPDAFKFLAESFKTVELRPYQIHQGENDVFSILFPK